MHQQILVLPVFLGKSCHTYLLLSTYFSYRSYKPHHEDNILQVLKRYDVVMLLPMEANNLPLESNMKVHQDQDIPLILKL